MIRTGVVSVLIAASDAAISGTRSAIINANAEQTIRVQLDPLTGCGACTASAGCAVQLLPVAQTQLFVDCQLPAGAAVSVGDHVQIQLIEPASDWLGIVLRAYGSPTIGMICGVMAGFWSAHALHLPQLTESLSLAGLVVGLAGGLIAWSRVEKSVHMRYAGENLATFRKVIQER